jgi:hypothetical protein
MPFIDFVSHIKKKQYVDFSAHPHCGMATYLVLEGDKVEPITKYLNVDGMLASMRDANRRFESGHRTIAKASAITGAVENVELGTFRKYLLPVLRSGSYESLSDLHHNMVMIGSMHFMDPYNFDVERVQRCVIHYATPDGRIIPFCTMNNIHRAEAEKRFAKPLDPEKNTPLYDCDALTRNIREGKVG